MYLNKKTFTAILFMLAGLFPQLLLAQTVKPFVLASVEEGSAISSVVSSTRSRLSQGKFEIIGQYSPYANAEILVFTSNSLRKAATKSPRGGYGAVLRVSITLNNGKVEVVFTNPVYWSNAYRMAEDLTEIRRNLEAELGFIEVFGSGEQQLSAEDMREYHYTFLMEYFDDPSVLAYFDSHQAAVETVNKNLSNQVAASQKVYQLNLGQDNEGKAMTLIGVGLLGEDKEDCSSDRYIMGKIDKSTPRHTAHLPYEILIYGDQAEALYGRFRIAISWPHLPMIASDTGATFLSIMCAPSAIESSLTRIAGGMPKAERESEK